ncbi:MAG: hypothetical protein AAF236_01030 [Verrucomicrobiota bacterium]
MTEILTQTRFPTDTPFDYQMAMDRLSGYRAPRDKLRQLITRGQIIQVRRGLYVAGPVETRGERIDRFVVAPLIYGPSCISLETALTYHSMIPERVESVTSVSLKRARRFETPLGRYEYFSVPETVFAIGVERHAALGGAYFIASPERALCDRVARNGSIISQKQIPDLLFADLRIDDQSIASLNVELIQEIAEAYRRRPVIALARWLSKKSNSSASRK